LDLLFLCSGILFFFLRLLHVSISLYSILFFISREIKNVYACRCFETKITFNNYLLQTEDRGQVEQQPILSHRTDVKAIGFFEAMKIPVSIRVCGESTILICMRFCGWVLQELRCTRMRSDVSGSI
jgi:hypothetical protein